MLSFLPKNISQLNQKSSIKKWAKNLNTYFPKEDIQMINKHMKRCSTPLIIRQMQIKTTMRQWHPTPVLSPGKSHRQRSLVGCSPWGCKESDMTERLHFHFSPSCFGEGNGNPLQRSCLEDPRDGGAWWAAIYGVAQSRTRLKQLSSSSSSCLLWRNATQVICIFF